jgi:hypothetical protein
MVPDPAPARPQRFDTAVPSWSLPQDFPPSGPGYRHRHRNRRGGHIVATREDGGRTGASPTRCIQPLCSVLVATPARKHRYSPSTPTHYGPRNNGNSSRHSSTNPPNSWQSSACQSVQAGSSDLHHSPNTSPTQRRPPPKSGCRQFNRAASRPNRFFAAARCRTVEGVTLALPHPAHGAFADDGDAGNHRRRRPVASRPTHPDPRIAVDAGR